MSTRGRGTNTRKQRTQSTPLYEQNYNRTVRGTKHDGANERRPEPEGIEGITRIEDVAFVKRINEYQDISEALYVIRDEYRKVKDDDKLLKNFKKVINARIRNGATLLELAICKGDTYSVVKLIEDYGANYIDTTRDDGKTPLMFICERGNIDMLNCIIKYHKEVVFNNTNAMLIEKFDKKNNTTTDLVLKIMNKNKRDLSKLLDAKMENGDNPLIIATRKGNYMFIEKLINSYADINITDIEKRNILLILLKNNDNIYTEETYNCMQLIINTKTELIHKQDGNGNTPLMTIIDLPVASKYCNLLLESGAKVDIQNKSGNTALIIASGEGAVDNIQLLLTHGADVNLKNKLGETALKRAVNRLIKTNQRILYRVILQLSKFPDIDFTSVLEIIKDQQKKKGLSEEDTTHLNNIIRFINIFSNNSKVSKIQSR